MGEAFALALRDALTPAGRRALVLSLLGALALMVALWIGAWLLLGLIHVARFPWLDWPIEILGGLAALILAWLLFPATSLLVLSLFLDRVIAAFERAHYPGLPPPRDAGIAEAIASGLRLALLGLVLNLAALPIYIFLPGISLVLFYALNGYLVGREYFEAVALRRLAPRDARALWHADRLRLIVAGAAIAFLLSIPLVNLAAPLIGAAAMLHLFEGMRRRAA
jgi:CysZ protein